MVGGATSMSARASAGESRGAPGTVVVVGSISVDLTASAAPLPRPGETVVGERFTSVLGGKGANQAVAAARAGAATTMIGAIGSDTFADVALDALGAAGVDVSAVEQVPGPTGVAHIRVDARTGENDIVIVPEANFSLDVDHVRQALEDAAPSAPVVLLQLETSEEVTLATAQACADLRLRLVLDPAPARVLPDDIWAGVWLACPNETEAELLTGAPVTDVRSAERAAGWFLDRGVRQVVLTRGGRGTVVVGPGGTSEIPAFPVTPIDTTAAGDAFAGFLGAAVAAGLPWLVALRRAAAAGALATTRAGASPSLPTAAEVDAYLSGR